MTLNVEVLIKTLKTGVINANMAITRKQFCWFLFIKGPKENSDRVFYIYQYIVRIHKTSMNNLIKISQYFYSI